MDTNNFCTCKDLKCPLNPANHDKGCSPCIRKNLKLREIPSCFFNLADGAEDMESYFFEDFARLVLKKDEAGAHSGAGAK